MQTTELMSIKTGDMVLIRNNRANIVREAGEYELPVIDHDEISFAVQDGPFGKWWFYRDNGHSYTGDATFVRRIEP